jgi:hypothetical protein
MKNQLLFKKMLMFIVVILCLQFATADCSTSIWIQAEEKLQKDGYLISLIQENNFIDDLCKINVDDSQYEIEMEEKIIHEQISIKLLEEHNVLISGVYEIFSECKLNLYEFETYVELEFNENNNNHTYNNELIILDEVNSDSCQFIINEETVEIPEDEFYVHNDILMKVDPFRDLCEVEFYTILDSKNIHFTLDNDPSTSDNNISEFSNREFKFLATNTNYDKCLIGVDSVYDWIDVGDDEIFDEANDILIIPYYSYGTTKVIEQELEKTCKIEISDCECDDDIECDSSCVDSDEDNDIFTKGTLEFSNEIYEDACFIRDESLFYSKNSCEEEECYVKQFSCDNDLVSSLYTSCSEGCTNGICEEEESIDNPDLSIYPDFFITNGIFNGLLIVGRNAYAKDTISLTNIALGLQRNCLTKFFECGQNTGEGCTTQTKLNAIPASVNEFDDEANLNNNIISIGNPCDNSITKDIMGSSECDYKLGGDKEGIIYLKKYGDYTHMAIYGLTLDDTYDISSILQDFDDYSFNGKINYFIDGGLIEVDEEDDEELEEEVPEEEIPEEEEVPEEEIPEEETNDDDKEDDENNNMPEVDLDECKKHTDCEDNNKTTAGYCLGSPKECKYEILDECKTNTDCKDNNEATTDICFGSPKKCKHEIIDECTIKKECDDKNPCTTDTCAGNPKKCLNKQNSGCNLNDVCVPIGTRDETKFCSAGNKLLDQKINSGTCNNNYECVSNVCVNSNCIEPGLIQKIIDWFTNFFG